ncbi:hypothetical protein WMY93_002560 [Mugilogobius chulae]|uniref:Ig-like domain-containing protein n=1 Tax=Mugilogobius chulae TaxID=88201 RepID=A0AAW0PWY9_9GOBI
MTAVKGRELELTCDVSSKTIQHTHLSVGWFLRKNTEHASHPLISIDRDFVLIPGQDFEERYKADQIRLDKIGELTHRLRISHLKVSDQGLVYCEAKEWIQDPDRTWYTIATKAATETTLTVIAKESSLLEGQRLSVSCSVNTQDLKQKFFSLAWLHGGVELARVGPTGVLTVGPDYSSRKGEGELWAARIGDRDYSLVLQSVRTTDQGEFMCRAWPEERSSTGDFVQGEAEDSKPHKVTISAQVKNTLSVVMPNSVSVKEGDKLELSCRVSGVTGQLSVIWQRKSDTSSSSFSDLVSLDKNGCKSTAPSLDRFTLELEEATHAAAGLYKCVVSERTTTDKVNSQEAASSVIVTALDAKISLISRNQNAAEGQEVPLMCGVRELNLPRNLTWSVRRNSTMPDNILTLYSNGAISWFGDHHNIMSDLILTLAQSIRSEINTDVDLRCSVSSKNLLSRYAVTWLLEQPRKNKTIVRSDQNAFVTFEPHLEQNLRQRLSVRRTDGPNFFLTIRNVRSSDQGVYFCEVIQWQQDPRQEWHNLPPVSKSTQLTLIEKQNTLSVVMPNSVSVKEGDKLELSCRVSGVTGQLSVIWQRKSDTSSSSFSDLVSLDKNGVMAKAEGTVNVSVKALRPSLDRFTLELEEATHAAAGLYKCVVSERTTTDKVNSQEAHPVLISRNQNAAEGQEVPLMCRVRELNLPRNLTWSVRRNSTMPDNILTLYSNGAISWFGDHQQYQLKIDNTMHKNEMMYYLFINSASKQDTGKYQCSVSVIVDRAPRTLVSSELAVSVKSPDVLFLQKNLLSRYAVTWLLEQPRKNKTIVRSDQNAFVTFEPHLEQNLRQRLSVRRTDGPNFFLTIRNVRSSDQGVYFCEVIQWQQDPRQEWHNLPPVSKKLDHTGLLKYPADQAIQGRQERMRLLRPTQTCFDLGIHTIHEEDSGTYVCRVEQYQLDRDGQWQQKASVETSPMTLNVNVTESHLFIEDTATEFNISTSQNLTIPCKISAQSSNQSEFQITWFWKKNMDTNQHPLFTAYRNSTLHYWFGKSSSRQWNVLLRGGRMGAIFVQRVEKGRNREIRIFNSRNSSRRGRKV